MALKRLYVFMIALVLSVSFPVSASKEADSSLKLFHSGWEHIRLYEFDRAEPIFRKLRSRFEVGSEQWIESSFGLAVSLEYKTPASPETISQAQKIYQELADKYPNHKCAPRALLNIGRIYELRNYYKDKIDLQSARKYYRFVIDRYADSPIVGEAVLRLAMSYTILCNRKSVYKGIDIMNKWISKHPSDKFSGLMYLHLGDVYFYPLREYRKCIDSYIRAEKSGAIAGSKEGFVYWRIAWLADHKLGDKEIAVKYYKKLIVEIPTFGKGYRAQLALKRLGVKDIPELKWRPKPQRELPG